VLSKHHRCPGPAPVLRIRNLEGKLSIATLADLPYLPLNVFPDLVSGHDFIIEVIRIVNIIIFPVGCHTQTYQARCDRAKEWGIWGSHFASERLQHSIVHFHTKSHNIYLNNCSILIHVSEEWFKCEKSEKTKEAF
jgi:hypothetical protein